MLGAYVKEEYLISLENIDNTFFLDKMRKTYKGIYTQFSLVQLLSRVRLFVTPWIIACQASYPSPAPGVYSNSRQWVGDAIQPSHPLLSPSPPAPNPTLIDIKNRCTCFLITKSCLILYNTTDSISLLCPWDFPGKNFGMGCHLLLQGIFPIQGSNPHLGHWQMDPLSSFQFSRSVTSDSFRPHGL